MALQKYLDRYAEPEVNALHNFPTDNIYDNVLVIPAFNESTEFIVRLLNSSFGKNVLLILVINQSDENNQQAFAKNQTLKDFIASQLPLKWQASLPSSISLFGIVSKVSGPKTFEQGNLDILLIDRFSVGHTIPAKLGVGLARKIGTDLATFLIAKQCVVSPWIHSSDADTLLPHNYFSAINDFSTTDIAANTAAVIYPFRHQIRNDDKDLNTAALLYEIALRYYVHGLKSAGSSYGFYTIGSVLAIHHKNYAEVRGFPQRSAGEDFYLLNKLNKTGSVVQLSEPIIEIESRYSDRVPFGTGPALIHINQQTDPMRTYLFYHPTIFFLLKIWQHAMLDLYVATNTQPTLPLKQQLNLVLAEYSLTPQQTDQLVECLIQLNFAEGLKHAINHSSSKHGRSATQFIKHLITWFDGFRTLKFVHYLRDNFYSSVTVDIVMQSINNHGDTLTREKITTENLREFNDELFRLTL